MMKTIVKRDESVEGMKKTDPYYKIGFPQSLEFCILSVRTALTAEPFAQFPADEQLTGLGAPAYAELPVGCQNPRARLTAPTSRKTFVCFYEEGAHMLTSYSTPLYPSRQTMTRESDITPTIAVADQQRVIIETQRNTSEKQGRNVA